MQREADESDDDLDYAGEFVEWSAVATTEDLPVLHLEDGFLTAARSPTGSLLASSGYRQFTRGRLIVTGQDITADVAVVGERLKLQGLDLDRRAEHGQYRGRR